MSIELFVLFAVTVLVLLFPVLRRVWIARRRRVRRAVGLTPLRRDILDRNVPLYRRLPTDLKNRLDGDINVFLAEKRFLGARGLAINDTIRLVIAAQACLLQLNQAVKYFPDFTSIIVYPDTYVATETGHDGVVEATRQQVRAGESWLRGPVVLSWADVRNDLQHPGNGSNVVLHEFAHKLDEADGIIDGAPDLRRSEQHRWATVFLREYERLRDDLEAGNETLLDPYAASAPTEFFAVAVETFFENPRELRRQHAELYAELARFFGLDPACWPTANTRLA